MQTSNKQKQNCNQLFRLTKEQVQEPTAVLNYFFECYHLKDLRELLWDWLLTALGSDNGTYAKGRERSNLIFLYEKLESLAEAAYLLQQPPSKKHKSRKKNDAL
ncbi:hypothetical protein [Paraflavitalea speifideaquila]|uniref:hypothetical protein n=1 Tax=Paraflavitalea speifideaquila TaxID=3076558 RepID=UPI0028EDCDDC|nr:hypothetical protein [Paraflavitalea speifideiaquila]